MFGIGAQRVGRSRRAASQELAPRAAGALSCLLLIASAAPASVWASGGPASVQAGGPANVRPNGDPASWASRDPASKASDTGTARAADSTGPPGGASRGAATALKNGVSYRGQLESGQRAWYKLETDEGERVKVRLWGRTPSCPVRATLIDGHGRALGEIVSTTHEIEPFIVYYPEGDTSPDYYLRVQPGPSTAACASAAYVFTLQEPEQEEPISCGSTPGPNGEPVASCTSPSKETAAPAYEARACASASRSYRRLESELARERARSARRRLEAEIGAARRAVIHGCRY
ncbi:MAG TPA: hypothetical protein VMG80_05065 [Solirubrobacteraceae bacterium]|nr:hypothetical protein [Solirubrobacteraceae bacterium]